MFFKLLTHIPKRRVFIFACLCLYFCPSAFVSATQFSVSGLNNSDIKDNVLMYLQQVNPPATEYEIDEYTQKLIKQTNIALQAFAYYDAEVSIAPIEYLPAAELQVSLDIALNQVTYVENVVIVSDLLQFSKKQKKHLPEQISAIITRLRQMQGKALDHELYNQLKNQLRVYTSLYGYFDFDLIVSKLLILPTQDADPKASQYSATIHWIFNLGERYTFGDTVFINEGRGQDIALSVKPFKIGEYFEQAKVGQFSIDMASTGYFSNALARANADGANNKTVPIEVLLSPKPKDLFKVGAGFSTDTKARLSFDWTRPWVNLRGHSLGANLYLSEPIRSLSLDYRIPKANPLNDFLNYRFELRQTDDNQTDSDLIKFEIQRQWGRKTENDWGKIGFFTFERERFTQGLLDEQTIDLVMPGFTFNRTRKKGSLFVDWGDRQQLTVQAGKKELLSDIDFFKILARTKWIREFGIHRINLRADLGAIATNDFTKVPSSQRFFAGGDQSVRGFAYNALSEYSLSIVDGEQELELLGGRYLSVVSAEYAIKVSPQWRIASFVDAGNASDNFADNIATGVGIGGHWLSPIGNVQFYIARGNSERENTWRLHLIIGPGL